MFGCLFRGLGDHGQVQAAADHAGDVAERHALVADSVIPGPRGPLLKRQPEEAGGIEAVNRGPAVEAVPHIRRNAFLTRDADQPGHESVVAVTMDRRWEAYDRRADALLRQ